MTMHYSARDERLLAQKLKEGEHTPHPTEPSFELVRCSDGAYRSDADRDKFEAERKELKR